MEDALHVASLNVKRLAESRLATSQQLARIKAARCLKRASEESHTSHTQAAQLRAENGELLVELLRWRKKTSVLRLKLASQEEDVRLRTENQAAMASELEACQREKKALLGQIASLKQQNTQEQVACAAAMQTELEAFRAEVAVAEKLVGSSQARVDALVADNTDLLQQLNGTQLMLQAANKRNHEMEADLSNERKRNRELMGQVSELQRSLSEAQTELRVALESSAVSEGKALIAEERVAMAEKALNEWRLLEEGRRSMMQERESALQMLSQERQQLNTDKASAAETRLQSQLDSLQSQLERELGRRHDSEQAMKTQLQAVQDRLHASRSRSKQLESQLAERDSKMWELQDELRRRIDNTPSKMVDQALGAVDKFVHQLAPVPEHAEHASGPEGIMYLENACNTGSLAQKMASRSKAHLTKQKATSNSSAAELSAEPPAAPVLPAAGEQGVDAGTTAGAASGARDDKPSQRSKRSLKAVSNVEEEDEAEEDEEEEVVEKRVGRGKKTGSAKIAKAAAAASKKGTTSASGSQKVAAAAAVEEGDADENDGGDDVSAAALKPEKKRHCKKASPKKAAAPKEIQPVQQESDAIEEEDGNENVAPNESHHSQSLKATQDSAMPSKLVYKSLTSSNPLASLNERVLEMAAARRVNLSATACAALKRFNMASTGGGAGKRKLLGAGSSQAKGRGADVVPQDMLFNSLRTPRVTGQK